MSGPRCVRCGAELPRHYDPCNPTRCEPTAHHELARRTFLTVYALVCAPVIVAVLFASHMAPAHVVAGVLFFWLTLYIGARHWQP